MPDCCHLLISEVTKPQMRQKTAGAEALRVRGGVGEELRENPSLKGATGTC